MFVPKSQNTVKVYEQKNAIQKNAKLGDYYITQQYFEQKMKSFSVHAGDIIVSCAGTIGETYVLPQKIEPGIINQALMRMRIYSPINVDYFLLYFDYIIKQTSIKNSKGSAIKNIPPFDVFKRILFPVPPFKEQNRIVNKIQEIEFLLKKYQIVEEQLCELNSNIKEKLKKSILQYAIEGKLVPQDPNDEPASVLLERIRKEKQKLIGEGKIKKDKTESIIYRRDNSYYEMLDKKVNCIDDKILFEIPNSWEWIRISSMASIVTKGTTPRGGNVAYQDYGIGFLRAENIAGFNKLNLSNLNYINKETHFGYLKRSILEANDILITIAGTLGRTAIVQEKDLPLNTNQAIAIVRLIPSISINYDYLIYAVNSPVIQKSLISQRKITAIPNLTLEMISECLIPIPPLKEQNRIIDKIQEIEYLCTKLIVK